MRFLTGFLAFIIAAGAFGFFAYRNYIAGPPITLPPPTRLDATTARGQLLPGGWANSSTITLTARGPKERVGLDVEIRPQGQVLKGAPTRPAPIPATSSTWPMGGTAGRRDCMARPGFLGGFPIRVP
jgi:hypothetical protein